MNPAMRSARDHTWHLSQRALRALGWTVLSAGWLWWCALRICLQVARAAPTFCHAEVLLVPGYRLRHDGVTPAFAARLRRALRLYRPRRRVLLSGHAARRDGQSEALAGHAFLCDQGLPAGAEVILESAARTTEENLQQAARLLEAQAKVVIISNRWHLARCAWLARQQGLGWKICAAESRWRPGPGAWLALAREGLSLLSYCGPAVRRLEPRQLLEIPIR